MVKENQTVSNATLKRLPVYLRFLYERESAGDKFISSVTIAENLKLNSVQVKKDLSQVSTVEGKPKVGFKLTGLINDIENFLGYKKSQKACLVGVGKLGSALLSYKGFDKYGLTVTAGFDINEQLFGNTISGTKIYPMLDIRKVCLELGVKMAIITVQAKDAQSVCDELIDAGVIGILNFAPVNLQVPDGVLVQDGDIAASLAILSTKLNALN
jgi:redox-sensing transcriptional repressor